MRNADKIIFGFILFWFLTVLVFVVILGFNYALVTIPLVCTLLVLVIFKETNKKFKDWLWKR